MRSLDIAGTGMQAQQTNVEVISNNMANMTTTGFKRRRAEFQDLIYQNLRRVGPTAPTAARSYHPARRSAWASRRRRSIASTSRATCSRLRTHSIWRFREWIFPGHLARRRDRLYTRRDIRTRGRRHPRHRRWLHRSARLANPLCRDRGDDQHLRPGAGRRFRARPRHRLSGSFSSRCSQTRRVWMHRAATCSCRPRHPGRR